MIGYTTVGTNDLEKAAAFYDALFADLGLKRIVPNERLILWSSKAGAAMFGVIKPFDGQPASSGNGTMVALMVDDAETVAKLHAKALELGATWQAYKASSSYIPFAAALSGRTRIHWRGIGWLPVIIGAVLYGVALIFHELLVGVAPVSFVQGVFG